MKVITYKNLNMGETIINFLVLLFQQVVFMGIMVIFIWIDYIFYIQKDYNDDDVGIIIVIIQNIAYLVINFFYLRGIKNAIFNFFTYEEYRINENILYYKKKLKLFKKSFCIRKFEINLTDIDDIYILPPKKFYHRGTRDGLAKYTEYFKPCERIKIKLIEGKEYYVCNYVKKPEYNDTDNEGAEAVFQVIANNIRDFIFEERENYKFQKKLDKVRFNYNLEKSERYNFILNKIVEEYKLFLYEDEKKFIINADEIAVKNLEALKDMNFEEIDFYVFYVNYLLKKEYEDKKVLVGFNGIDGKEVTMSKLKNDINEIRDSKSTFI